MTMTDRRRRLFGFLVFVFSITSKNSVSPLCCVPPGFFKAFLTAGSHSCVYQRLRVSQTTNILFSLLYKIQKRAHLMVIFGSLKFSNKYVYFDWSNATSKCNKIFFCSTVELDLFFGM